MRSPIFSRLRTLLVVAVISATLATASEHNMARAASTDIPDYVLRYGVKIKGFGLGDLVITSEHSEDRTQITGETFPNAIAGLFGDGKVVELIEYRNSGQGLKLSRITEKKGRELDDITIVNVSADGKNIDFAGKNKNYALRAGEQIDANTFPLLTLLGINDFSAGKRERVVSGKRVREYQYNESTTETITVPAGEFETLKVSKTRLDDSSKIVTTWMTLEPPRYPVKITIVQNGKPGAVISLLKKER